MFGNRQSRPGISEIVEGGDPDFEIPDMAISLTILLLLAVSVATCGNTRSVHGAKFNTPNLLDKHIVVGLRGGMPAATATATATLVLEKHQGSKVAESRQNNNEGQDFGGKGGYDFHMHDWYTNVDNRDCDGEEAENEPGISYDEWIARHKATEERIRLERDERHDETDYGAGYVDGRYGMDVMMGWQNYLPLTAGWQSEVGKMPQLLLDRHLLQAAADGDCDVISQLLSFGASVTAHNNESFLPATVRYGLNACGSNASMQGSIKATYGSFTPEHRQAVVCVYNWTLAHWAACNGHADAIELLGSKGAPLSNGDDSMMTPLHVAAGQNDVHVIDALLRLGANATAADCSGNSALHLAALEGAMDAAAALLRGGADPSQVNHDEYSPLHWAAKQGHTQIISLLLSHGADAGAECSGCQDLTALQMAEEQGHWEACDLLANHLGMVKVGPEELNSYERQKLDQDLRLRIENLRGDLMRSIKPSITEEEIKEKISEHEKLLERIRGMEDEHISEHGPPPDLGYRPWDTPLDEGYKSLDE